MYTLYHDYATLRLIHPEWGNDGSAPHPGRRRPPRRTTRFTRGTRR
jgi:hypothetical protein